MSKPFLTIVADDLRQFGRGCARDECGRAFAVRRVHSHVERAVVAIRETAHRLVELRRRHAEIEQDAVDLRDPLGGEEARQIAVLAVHEPGAAGT